MTDTDTLLSQALALVNEDQRGELADLIEAIIVQVQHDLAEVLGQSPRTVYALATGPRLYDIQGIYATRAALEADARRRRIHAYDVGELMVTPEVVDDAPVARPHPAP